MSAPVLNVILEPFHAWHYAMFSYTTEIQGSDRKTKIKVELVFFNIPFGGVIYVVDLL